MKILISTVLSILFLLLLTFVWNKGKDTEIKENEEKQQDKFDKNTYEKRMKWLYGYLVFSILIFWLFFVFKDVLTENIAQILFCFASTFLGAFTYGYKFRIRSKANPVPAYSLYYPLIIIVFTSSSFALTSIILKVVNISDNIIFYTLAFPVSVYFGHHIDNLIDLGNKIKGS